MDIIADDHQEIMFDPLTDVSDIHVYAKNAGNKELTVNVPKNKSLEDQTPIRLVFDHRDFPVVDFPEIYAEYNIPPHVTLYYLKIELTYTSFNPDNFTPVRYPYPRKILHRPAYKYRVLVRGPVNPKFFITVPRGWGITPVNFPNADINEGNGTKAMIFNYPTSTQNISQTISDLNLKTSYIEIDDEKRKYLYECDENIHSRYNQAFKSGSNEYVVALAYSIEPSNFAVIFTVFQLFILLLGLLFISIQFSADEEDLVWPILTTIATWITITEINIQQERRGYYYPWRKGFKYLVLFISLFEVSMILSMLSDFSLILSFICIVLFPAFLLQLLRYAKDIFI